MKEVHTRLSFQDQTGWALFHRRICSLFYRRPANIRPSCVQDDQANWAEVPMEMQISLFFRHLGRLVFFCLRRLRKCVGWQQGWEKDGDQQPNKINRQLMAAKIVLHFCFTLLLLNRQLYFVYWSKFKHKSLVKTRSLCCRLN